MKHRLVAKAIRHVKRTNWHRWGQRWGQLVTTSKALVTRSYALVTSSFLFLIASNPNLVDIMLSLANHLQRGICKAEVV